MELMPKVLVVSFHSTEHLKHYWMIFPQYCTPINVPPKVLVVLIQSNAMNGHFVKFSSSSGTFYKTLILDSGHNKSCLNLLSSDILSICFNFLLSSDIHRLNTRIKVVWYFLWNSFLGSINQCVMLWRLKQCRLDFLFFWNPL